ncbi:unnamed protein product [Arabidopsis halleri]
MTTLYIKHHKDTCLALSMTLSTRKLNIIVTVSVKIIIPYFCI